MAKTKRTPRTPGNGTKIYNAHQHDMRTMHLMTKQQQNMNPSQASSQNFPQCRDQVKVPTAEFMVQWLQSLQPYFQCVTCRNFLHDVHTAPQCFHKFCGTCASGNGNIFHHKCTAFTNKVCTRSNLKRDRQYDELAKKYRTIMEMIGEANEMKIHNTHANEGTKILIHHYDHGSKLNGVGSSSLSRRVSNISCDLLDEKEDEIKDANHHASSTTMLSPSKSPSLSSSSSFSYPSTHNLKRELSRQSTRERKKKKIMKSQSEVHAQVDLTRNDDEKIRKYVNQIATAEGERNKTNHGTSSPSSSEGYKCGSDSEDDDMPIAFLASRRKIERKDFLERQRGKHHEELQQQPQPHRQCEGTSTATANATTNDDTHPTENQACILGDNRMTSHNQNQNHDESLHPQRNHQPQSNSFRDGKEESAVVADPLPTLPPQDDDDNYKHSGNGVTFLDDNNNDSDDGYNSEGDNDPIVQFTSKERSRKVGYNTDDSGHSDEGSDDDDDYGGGIGGYGVGMGHIIDHIASDEDENDHVIDGDGDDLASDEDENDHDIDGGGDGDDHASDEDENDHDIDGDDRPVQDHAEQEIGGKKNNEILYHNDYSYDGTEGKALSNVSDRNGIMSTADQDEQSTGVEGHREGDEQLLGNGHRLTDQGCDKPSLSLEPLDHAKAANRDKSESVHDQGKPVGESNEQNENEQDMEERQVELTPYTCVGANRTSTESSNDVDGNENSKESSNSISRGAESSPLEMQRAEKANVQSTITNDCSTEYSECSDDHGKIIGKCNEVNENLRKGEEVVAVGKPPNFSTVDTPISSFNDVDENGQDKHSLDGTCKETKCTSSETHLAPKQKIIPAIDHCEDADGQEKITGESSEVNENAHGVEDRGVDLSNICNMDTDRTSIASSNDVDGNEHSSDSTSRELQVSPKETQIPQKSSGRSPPNVRSTDYHEHSDVQGKTTGKCIEVDEKDIEDDDEEEMVEAAEAETPKVCSVKPIQSPNDVVDNERHSPVSISREIQNAPMQPHSQDAERSIPTPFSKQHNTIEKENNNTGSSRKGSDSDSSTKNDNLKRKGSISDSSTKTSVKNNEIGQTEHQASEPDLEHTYLSESKDTEMPEVAKDNDKLSPLEQSSDSENSSSQIVFAKDDDLDIESEYESESSFELDDQVEDDSDLDLSDDLLKSNVRRRIRRRRISTRKSNRHRPNRASHYRSSRDWNEAGFDSSSQSDNENIPRRRGRPKRLAKMKRSSPASGRKLENDNIPKRRGRPKRIAKMKKSSPASRRKLDDNNIPKRRGRPKRLVKMKRSSPASGRKLDNETSSGDEMDPTSKRNTKYLFDSSESSESDSESVENKSRKERHKAHDSSNSPSVRGKKEKTPMPLPSHVLFSTGKSRTASKTSPANSQERNSRQTAVKEEETKESTGVQYVRWSTRKRKKTDFFGGANILSNNEIDDIIASNQWIYRYENAEQEAIYTSPTDT